MNPLYEFASILPVSSISIYYSKIPDLQKYNLNTCGHPSNHAHVIVRRSVGGDGINWTDLIF